MAIVVALAEGAVCLELSERWKEEKESQITGDKRTGHFSQGRL